MDSPGLRAVIQQLKETNSKENAYLGFFYNNDNSKTCYIKANKDGLELYAAKLLEASLDMEYKLFYDNRTEVFNFSSESFFVNQSDIQFSYVQLIHKTKAEIETNKEKLRKPLKSPLIKYCFTGVLILILISTIVGIITIFSWLT